MAVQAVDGRESYEACEARLCEMSARRFARFERTLEEHDAYVQRVLTDHVLVERERTTWVIR